MSANLLFLKSVELTLFSILIFFDILVAEVQLQTNEFNISSTLTFKQLSIADPLIIHGRIIGLPPGKVLEITYAHLQFYVVLVCMPIRWFSKLYYDIILILQ